MRATQAAGRSPAICFLLAVTLSALPGAAASQDLPGPKVVKWTAFMPLNPLSQYTGLVVGLDGRIWVTDLWDKDILAFDTPHRFTTISTGSFSPHWMARGANGDLYTNEGDTLILKIDPAGNMTTFALGQAAQSGVSAGPDGSVWVPEQSELGRIFPDGTVREYPVIAGDMVLSGTSVTQAPAGDVWFDAYTPDYGGYLAQMDPKTGAIRKHTAHACGTGNALPIIAAPDGRVWVVCGSLDTGYEIDGFGPDGTIRVPWPANLGFTTVGGYDNAAIGPDNAIWMVGQNIVGLYDVSGAILRFDLASHKVHKYVPPGDDQEWANGFTFDTHGNIWAGNNAGQIEQVILR